MRVVECAIASGVNACVVDLPEAVSGKWRFERPSQGTSELRYGGETLKLNPSDSFFCRIVDLSQETPFSSQAIRWHAFIDALRSWLNLVPARVANRCDRCLHNSSKPFHETILQEMGFQVPESITSCTLDRLLNFTNGGPTISKTVCGERADCILVDASDFREFLPENGPVHLQRLISGADARIHVIGDQVVGQRIAADCIDYRRGGNLQEMEVFAVPTDLKNRLVSATSRMELAFAGWDFKIDANNIYWCLEANPMPGYLPYDVACQGAISQALVRYLGNRD